MALNPTPLKVFISYKWEGAIQNRWTERFATDLRHAGINAILDRWEVKLGDSFTGYMTSKIAESDVILFIVTTKAVEAIENAQDGSGALKFEIQLATARRIAGENVRIIPIYREGHRLPAYVKDHRYADFRNDSEYQESLNSLLQDLRGEVQSPPVRNYDDLQETGSIGEDLQARLLRAEFFPQSYNLVVWSTAHETHNAGLVRYELGTAGYTGLVVEPAAFASMVKTASNGDLVVVASENKEILVLDCLHNQVNATLETHALGFDSICSILLHPNKTIAYIGSHYGQIAAWDWKHNEIIFTKTYFPRREVVYISQMTFGPHTASIFFSDSNTVYQIGVRDGDLLRTEFLGEWEEETAGISYNSRTGLLAIGGVMQTRVYLDSEPFKLHYTSQNLRPLAQSLSFSNDGAFLTSLEVMGGGAASIRVARTGTPLCEFRPGSISPKNFTRSSIDSISIPSDSKLFAVGEGGRIGLYRFNLD
jgi:hypothetical protein